jgi:transcription initiation factor TFIIIB Brf1 subunit/transcription initiation factor TFIIB
LSRHNNKKNEKIPCLHENLKQDGGYMVCRDCGLVIDEGPDFDSQLPSTFYSDSQLDYERKIRTRDSRAIQDPVIKQKYDRLKTLNKWFRDYHTNFSEQKKAIELLKGYGIGLNINDVKLQQIKDRYMRYNKYHRQTYQNMIIIFLAIVWLEIKDTTKVRVEQFIGACQELGHKINKKMLSNAMAKVRRTELKLETKSIKTPDQLEQDIKKKIKIIFQKDINNIPFEKVKEHFSSQQEFNRLKIDMQLVADNILAKISYDNLRNLNFKAFTAGLIYYIGQTLENPKIFTQNLIEETSRFSSTTIRKKFHILKEILGKPEEFTL